MGDIYVFPFCKSSDKIMRAKYSIFAEDLILQINTFKNEKKK